MESECSVVRQIFSDCVSAEDLSFTKYRFPGKIRLGDNRIKRTEFVEFPKLVIDNVTVEKPEMAVMK